MAQAAGRHTFTLKTPFRFQNLSCGIYGGKSDSMTGFIVGSNAGD
jgi:hypothetical protein